MNFDIAFLREKLNEAQLEAVRRHEGPHLILAGAGSGKTRVLTYKVAFLIRRRQVPAYGIMAVTFTNKAAAEMKTRVENLLWEPVSLKWVGTFHSVCARILRVHAAQAGYAPGFSIYDREDQKKFIKKLLKEEREDGFSCGRLIAAFSRFKNSYIGPVEARQQAGDRDEERLGYLYLKYQAGLRGNNALDFDDLIFQTITLLKENPGVRDKFRENLPYILIDEFQDTNKAQYYLVKQLLGPHRNITAVGDDDQSIYGWRGADISNILSFENDFPGTAVIRLEQNYRSTKNILGIADSVISNNRNRLGKGLWTANQAGHKIQVHRSDTETAEAEWVVSRIATDSQYHPGETAIFYRTNAQSRVLEDSLRRRNISYLIYGGIRFYDRKEVKDILAYLKILVNPLDSVSAGRVINVPKRGIGTRTVELFAEFALSNSCSLVEAMQKVPASGKFKSARQKVSPFLSLLDSLSKDFKPAHSVSDSIKEVIKRIEYDTYLEQTFPEDASDKQRNVNELVAAAQDFESRNPDRGLEDFVQEISLLTQEDTVKKEKASVSLMTVHSAKGLEFEKVYVTGLEDGLFPLLRDMDTDALEEERRLFYVAVTRARKSLVLTCAASRRMWGNALFSRVSRFLEEADARYLEEIFPEKRPGTPVSKGLYYEPVTEDVLPEPEEIQVQTGFRPGKRIRHIKFGEGKILKKEGYGGETRLLVSFLDGISRRLVLKYAKISLLD